MEGYFPSNGTEGMIFQALYCEKCYKERNCTILANSMLGKEPKQWILNDNGEPECSSFRSDRPKTIKKQNYDNDLFQVNGEENGSK